MLLIIDKFNRCFNKITTIKTNLTRTREEDSNKTTTTLIIFTHNYKLKMITPSCEHHQYKKLCKCDMIAKWDSFQKKDQRKNIGIHSTFNVDKTHTKEQNIIKSLALI